MHQRYAGRQPFPPVLVGMAHRVGANPEQAGGLAQVQLCIRPPKTLKGIPAKLVVVFTGAASPPAETGSPFEVGQEIANIQHGISRPRSLDVHQSYLSVRQHHHLFVVEVVVRDGRGLPVLCERVQYRNGVPVLRPPFVTLS